LLISAAFIDVVVSAMTGATTSHDASIPLNVPVGTALTNNKITLVAVSASRAAPATITGQVTSAGLGGTTVVDVTLSPVQQAVPTGGQPGFLTGFLI
jgi:hypothetical protein